MRLPGMPADAEFQCREYEDALLRRERVAQLQARQMKEKIEKETRYLVSLSSSEECRKEPRKKTADSGEHGTPCMRIPSTSCQVVSICFAFFFQNRTECKNRGLIVASFLLIGMRRLPRLHIPKTPCRANTEGNGENIKEKESIAERVHHRRHLHLATETPLRRSRRIRAQWLWEKQEKKKQKKR